MGLKLVYSGKKTHDCVSTLPAKPPSSTARPKRSSKSLETAHLEAFQELTAISAVAAENFHDMLLNVLMQSRLYQAAGYFGDDA